MELLNIVYNVETNIYLSTFLKWVTTTYKYLVIEVSILSQYLEIHYNI